MTRDRVKMKGYDRLDAGLYLENQPEYCPSGDFLHAALVMVSIDHLPREVLDDYPYGDEDDPTWEWDEEFEEPDERDLEEFDIDRLFGDDDEEDEEEGFGFEAEGPAIQFVYFYN